MELKDFLEKSKSLSDLSRYIFGKENYTNREKCKKILEENGINWETWLAEKKVKPKRYCLYCGKEITDGDYRKKFCNHSCAISYNNQLNIRRCGRKKKQIHYCLNCGKELTRNDTKFCNQKCQIEYNYKNNINNWKNNGELNVSNDWVPLYIRRYLTLKNNNKCQICGWGEENPYTHKVPLQVHHIDGDCTNNKEENLQLLCPNCHSLTETFGNNGKHSSKRYNRHNLLQV